MIAARPLCLLAVLLAMASPGSAQQTTDRPNILWIIAEDFGPELSCYGHPQVWTPSIDSLAEEGVRFTHAYTVTAVCSTSRSSFMTGMYAFTIGAHNHRSHRDDGHSLPVGVRVLTDWFREAGYFTANVRQFPQGVDLKGTGKTDWNFAYDGRPFDSAKWSDLKSNQPFYAQVNFPETHRGSSFDVAHTRIERTADPEKVRLPEYYPDHPIARADWAQYLNAAMSLDRKVGIVIEQLQTDGLWGNTIVAFLGDHGRAMVRGKQWPYESGLHIPLIVRWPDSFSPPVGFARGSVSDDLTASIDLSATSLDWAGIPKPAKMQGRIFGGPNADTKRTYVFGGRDRGDETVDRIRTVRDKRFRYIRNYYPERPFAQINRYKEASYPVLRLMHRLHDSGELAGLNPHADRLMQPTRPREELYDLEADPYEVHNLAEDPDHEETLVRLRRVLEEWVTEIDDQGRFPESPELIEEWESKMRQTYDERLKRLYEAESGPG